jgi:hypothetical protein
MNKIMCTEERHFTLDEMVWLKNVAFFREDAMRDMRDAGILQRDADLIVHTDAFKVADIVGFWQSYHNTYAGAAFEKYLAYLLEKRP